MVLCNYKAWSLFGYTLFAFALTALASLVELPPPPTLTKAGHDLITSFEGFDYRPAWAGGESGVDVGYGYDTGFYSKAVILSDWRELPDSYSQRLAEVSGITGARAYRLIPHLYDILVSLEIGTRVFDNVDVAREFSNCKRAFSGFENLRPNAQAALISLSFNRGTSMIGPSRLEMRNIRALVPNKDYDGIAQQLRAMVHVWKGTSIYAGMYRRRFAEAKLVETP
jgi:Phage lysozyme